MQYICSYQNLTFFREFSREYESLGYMVPAQVEEKTGCRMPCVYNEFRFFGNPLVKLKKEGTVHIHQSFPGNLLRWFWSDSLEHVPLHHNGDRGVDLPLPLLGQFHTICQLNVLSICKLSVHTGPNILTQRWLSSVEPLVSSLASPSSPFGTDLLPSSPYRQNIEQPPNYYL